MLKLCFYRVQVSKGCPFCGSMDIRQGWWQDKILCNVCDAGVPWCTDGPNPERDHLPMAIAHWDHRPNKP